ncbi:MAG: acetyltransferase [Betaproteobacteria bacterium]|nr:acetyltransferase [Betaproteobacteria bacterium]
MRFVDVFNGDADGLCALRQLRLTEPCDAELITGAKRDIELLARANADTDTVVTVLDISLERNRPALDALLAKGVRVRYYDHHFPGAIPAHANLEAHIDTAADVCTSVIVDRALQGRYRAWAITAAFGDNLLATAERLSDAQSLSLTERATLRTLGEAINYNAYGETVADLHIHPADLYRRMASFDSPFSFATGESIVPELITLRTKDLAAALNVPPHATSATSTIHRLPDAPWSRRVLGSLAHHLAATDAKRAHAVLAPNRDGTYSVSVRAGTESRVTAHAVCVPFGGAGRHAAAGIDRLPATALAQFTAAFQAAQ